MYVLGIVLMWVHFLMSLKIKGGNMEVKFENQIIENIFKDRYSKNNETAIETLTRVANHCGGNTKEKKDFLNVMANELFYPAGRTISNSGIGKNLTLNNCFVSPQIRDDLSDIFDKVKLGSVTHQKGGKILATSM